MLYIKILKLYLGSTGELNQTNRQDHGMIDIEELLNDWLGKARDEGYIPLVFIQWYIPVYIRYIPEE